MITYRRLTINDLDKMDAIDASQYIGRAWRLVEGVRQLITIDYHDPTWPNGYETHRRNLQLTIESQGVALGAFDADGQLVGLATVNPLDFGKRATYALLDQLFITRPLRGGGIGRQLFYQTGAVAKSWGADKLLICAGSAEETIAFYRSIGCVDAVEIHSDFFESDPRDIQLEYTL